jgi:hypothetical protein
MKVKGNLGVKIVSSATLSGIGVGSFLVGSSASRAITNGTLNSNTPSITNTPSNILSSETPTDPFVVISPLESTFSDLLSNDSPVEIFLFGLKIIVFFNLVSVIYLIISFISK